MIPSQNCYDLIKKFEGCFLKAYLCPAGIPTIGWGSTMYDTGIRVKMGETITQGYADILLAWETDKKGKVVDRLIKNVNQNQFDAVVSFTYNVGIGAFQGSTLEKRIKLNPNEPTIRDAFMMWNKAIVDGKLKVLFGLTKRRKAEADLYFS